MPSYRNRKLLDLAHRVQDCQLQISANCEGSTPNGCEPAHSNQLRHGKGVGIKADDCFHCAACHTCHAELDNGKLHRETKQEAWQQGFERTMKLYLEMGWLKVAA